MLKQEFEKIAGIQVTDKEYETIEETYLAVPNMQKDEFCKEYVKMKDNHLFKAMMNIIAPLSKESRNNKSKIKSLAHFMIDESVDDLSVTLRDKAAELIGMKAVIAYNARKKYEFDNDELEFIANQLSL